MTGDGKVKLHYDFRNSKEGKLVFYANAACTARYCSRLAGVVEAALQLRGVHPFTSSTTSGSALGQCRCRLLAVKSLSGVVICLPYK